MNSGKHTLVLSFPGLGFEKLRHEPRDSSLFVAWIAREH
jgi:hypothetical protein